MYIYYLNKRIGKGALSYFYVNDVYLSKIRKLLRGRRELKVST